MLVMYCPCVVNFLTNALKESRIGINQPVKQLIVDVKLKFKANISQAY
jgi:hypothetical protein